MANKKKKSSSGGKKRRGRIGAVGISAKNSLPVLIGSAAGVAGGRALSRVMSNMDPKVQAALKLVAGFFVSGSSSPLLKGIGYGLFGAGALDVAQSLNLISGVPVRFNPISGAPARNVVPQITGLNSAARLQDSYMGFPPDIPLIGVVDTVFDKQ